MEFQDQRADGRPLEQLGVFAADGRLVELIAPGPYDTTAAYELRNRLDAEGTPGCEVLTVCPGHPDTSAVDCLICWSDN